MSASWCFCTALGSLLSSCCGNDKDSTVPPSVTSGRKRSIFLLFLSLGFAFLFQYGIGPNVAEHNNKFLPFKYIENAWLDGCEQYVDDDGNYDLQKACTGNAGVYRAAGSAFFFFTLAALGAYCKPTSNREAWVAKYTLFLFLVFGTIFIPNNPIFLPIFVNIFRAGAVLYMIFNQLIILDMCFNVNESWVEKADRADIEEEYGAGKKWLGALLGLCTFLYILCFVSIGLMYAYFGGCSNNIAFITVTLIMGIICTAVQLSGEESSLFTSASIFTYATYLLYTAVSKNPNGQCNPQLGENDVAGIALGVGLTLIGMLWTGLSSTAYKTVGDESDELLAETDENGGREENENNSGGVAIAESSAPNHYGTMEERGTQSELPVTFSTSWKMNIILAAICCWFAMVLTSWGSIISNGSVANPSAGEVSMWMVITSQWLIFLLYLWTLVAPRLFPDRDFS